MELPQVQTREALDCEGCPMSDQNRRCLSVAQQIGQEAMLGECVRLIKIHNQTAAQNQASVMF